MNNISSENEIEVKPPRWIANIISGTCMWNLMLQIQIVIATWQILWLVLINLQHFGFHYVFHGLMLSGFYSFMTIRISWYPIWSEKYNIVGLILYSFNYLLQVYPRLLHLLWIEVRIMFSADSLLVLCTTIWVCWVCRTCSSVAEIWGLLGLRLADDLVLPFDYPSYSAQLHVSTCFLRSECFLCILKILKITFEFK